jgi:8-oxo-dGTP pyrophosphatase MutT (NUDIX family)
MIYTAAGGVVTNERGDEVLLLIRPSRDEVRLPKGHIEADEGPVRAALREVREEAGYDDLEIIADLGEQLVTFLSNEQTIRRTERYFLMRARSLARAEQPSSDELQFFAVWVPWDQAQAHLTFEAEQEWIRRARRALEQRQ